MSILKAYKKLQKESKRRAKMHGEIFLCNITYDLMTDDKITEKEHDAIIEDIESHMKSVIGRSGGATMYHCIDKKSSKLSYEEISVIANQYRLAWLEMQIIRYSLTAE